MVWVRKLPRITHSERMTDYTDVKRIREELPTMQPEHEPMAPRCLDERIGLKSTVEPRVTYPERRLFGRAARRLF